MNKRILGIACACLLGCQALRAQEMPQQGDGAPGISQDTVYAAVSRPKHEFYAAYGVLSFQMWIEALSMIFSSGDYRIRGYGPVQVGYNYRLSEKWSIGVLGSYTSFTGKYLNTGKVDMRDRFYCIMPRVDGYWVRRQKLQLYSGFAVGTCAYRFHDVQTGETDKFSSVAGHLNVMGLRIGDQRTAYFAEFGYGFNGLINLGLSIRL